MVSNTNAAPTLFLPAWMMPATEMMLAPGALPVPPFSAAAVKSTQFWLPLLVVQLSVASWPLLVGLTRLPSEVSSADSSTLSAVTLIAPVTLIVTVELLPM